MAEPLPLIISVDDHVVEPPNVWQDRLPAKYARRRSPGRACAHARARVPRVDSSRSSPGREGTPVDWWYYEDLKRPLLRLDSAVGRTA